MDIESDSPTRAYVGRPHGRANKIHGLAVVAGPASGARRLIDEEEIRIGKAPSNHLCVPDPTVSRFHCVIERTAARPAAARSGQLQRHQGRRLLGRERLPDARRPHPDRQQRAAGVRRRGRGPQAPVDPRKGGPRVLGNSTAMESIVAVLPRLAQSGATVLLEGETGTGKSMIAELIHRMGPRAGGPFVVVDCGALAPSLVESELFGHERGRVHRRRRAAHGRLRGRAGRHGVPRRDRRAAAGAAAQAAAGAGGAHHPPPGVHPGRCAWTCRWWRPPTATCARRSARGTFRADLYYRLEALRLVIPPLRERREDIPPLVEHFCRRTRADIPEALVERMKSRVRRPALARQRARAAQRRRAHGAAAALDGRSHADRPIGNQRCPAHRIRLTPCSAPTARPSR